MKRALQIAIAIAGAVPAIAGLGGMLLGSSLLGDASGSADLDSQFRFLSALSFAIGLVIWSTIRGIERKGKLLRLLTGILVLGGVARLPSIFSYDLPESPILVSLVVEIAVMPLLCLWQSRLASQTDNAAESAGDALT
jgi:membrane protease YdiL (CAAX protease family)